MTHPEIDRLRRDLLQAHRQPAARWLAWLVGGAP
jgi:hypothetical protein